MWGPSQGWVFAWTTQFKRKEELIWGVKPECLSQTAVTHLKKGGKRVKRQGGGAIRLLPLLLRLSPSTYSCWPSTYKGNTSMRSITEPVVIATLQNTTVPTCGNKLCNSWASWAKRVIHLESKGSGLSLSKKTFVYRISCGRKTSCDLILFKSGVYGFILLVAGYKVQSKNWRLSLSF